MFKSSCVSYLNLMNAMVWQVVNLHVGQLPIDQDFMALSISEADRAEFDTIPELVVRSENELDRLQKALRIRLGTCYGAGSDHVNLVGEGRLTCVLNLTLV